MGLDRFNDERGNLVLDPEARDYIEQVSGNNSVCYEYRCLSWCDAGQCDLPQGHDGAHRHMEYHEKYGPFGSYTAHLIRTFWGKR